MFFAEGRLSGSSCRIDLLPFMLLPPDRKAKLRREVSFFPQLVQVGLSSLLPFTVVILERTASSQDQWFQSCYVCPTSSIRASSKNSLVLDMEYLYFNASTLLHAFAPDLYSYVSNRRYMTASGLSVSP